MYTIKDFDRKTLIIGPTFRRRTSTLSRFINNFFDPASYLMYYFVSGGRYTCKIILFLLHVNSS